MDWLNYHHLLYFWVVAREGGLVAAGKVLRLSHPTLSTQIHALEDRLGEKLFVKVGRKLVLTEFGRVAFRYADEIFSLGRELVDTLKGRPTDRPLRLNVGIADVVPKLLVRQILQPALSLSQPVRLVCREASHERLLADLATYALDVVISDAPVPSGSPVRAYNHLLGESSITWFGTASLAKRYRRGFPRSLDGAPVLLPLEDVTLRRSLNQWFARHGITPRIVAEFEDSALLKAFGRDGVGLFPGSTAATTDITSAYDVTPLGVVEEVRERLYAISVERKLKHPAVVAILAGARETLVA
ncbi:MAG: transcriptional activator NhaR [Archangium sp.]|nr:transcriptional activator NhaR [Archangium sp.]